MTEKTSFIKEVERQIDNRTAEIAKFRVIAEVAEPDDQIRFYQIIEEIVKKENDVKEKLDDFEKSGGENLADLKNEINTLQQRVEKAIDDARVKVN